MLKDDAWFSGFVAGEGSFYLAGPRHVPRFSIKLRDDDSAVLLLVQQSFGGRLLWGKSNYLSANGLVDWSVTNKKGLRGLVEYFDRFPLYNKKAWDYALWREAVLAYLRAGYRAPELATIAASFRDVRDYSPQQASMVQRHLEAVA
jgi:hypothetical protein